MNEAMLSFLEIVKVCAPWSLAWVFGVKAYCFVVDALSGRNARL